MKINPKDLNRHEAHDRLTEMVLPRPIAFVSTIGRDGVFNLAPYSYFSPLCNLPMIVGFSIGRKKDGQKKDTLVNIEQQKEFVIAAVSEAIARPMVKTAAAYAIDVDEFEKAGLTPASADRVAPPLVAESPINLECRLLQILEFGERPHKNSFVIGEVVLVHVEDEFFTGNQIDASKLKLIGRLGGKGKAYCRTTDIFNIKREAPPE